MVSWLTELCTQAVVGATRCRVPFGSFCVAVRYTPCKARGMAATRQRRLRRVVLALLVLSVLPESAHALWEVCSTSWVEVHQGIDGPLLRIEDYQVEWCYNNLDGQGMLRVNVPRDVPGTPGVPPIRGRKLDPVTGDGEFIQSETDLTFPGQGLPYQFTRTYRSRAPFKSNLGYGWDHNYNQWLQPNCDSTVAYSNGEMGTTVFQPDPANPGHWLPDYREKLALALIGKSSSGTQLWTLTDWKTGNVETFEQMIGSRANLTTITAPAGGAIHVSWSTAKGSYVTAVADSSGQRTIYYNYFPPPPGNNASTAPPLLWCLSLTTDCSAPLVAFDYDWVTLDLTWVTKGSDTAGTAYKYHGGEASVSWMPSTSAAAECESLCNPKSFNCQNADYCGAIFRMARVPPNDYNACIRAQQAFCHEQYCANSTDPLCDGNNCDPEDGKFDSPCRQYYNYASYQNQWLALYSGPGRPAPFCTDAWTGQANCISRCVDFHRNAAYAYTFGIPADLNHNLVEIDDANGNVVLKNTYGTNPGDISFDRVIDQQLGSSAHGKFQYHDLDMESTYTTAPLPSTPDPTHVVPKSQFKSLQICPTLNCSGTSCPGPVDDSNGDPPSQRAAFATVFTDIYGDVVTDYYDPGWDLVREVNWGDVATGVQTTDYNYGNSGSLTSDGQVSAIRHPAGDRRCYWRNDAGAPRAIVHVPAPGYAGNAEVRTEDFDYVGSLQTAPTSSLLADYVPDAAGTAIVTYNGPFGSLRPDSVTVHVSATTATTTTFGYGSDFLPHSKTDASGAVTRFDNFDSLAAQPQLVTVDANSSSPVQTYVQFDPVFSMVQESGLTGGAAVHYTYDRAARPTAIQRRNSPQDDWFVQTLTYNNTPYPMQITDSNLSQSPVYNVYGDLVSLTKFPADSDDGPAQRTCNNYAMDGRLLGTIHPEGDSTLYKYDAVGHLTSVVRGFDKVAQRGCPAPNPQPGDPGLETVSASTYGHDGFLKSYTKNGVTYAVTVDGFGRVIETANGVGVKVRKGYDHLDRVVWEATYQDAYDPVCKKHVPPNCPESIIPPYGQPQFGDIGLASATEYTYDDVGRVTSVARWHLEDGTKDLTTTTYDDTARTITTTEAERTWSDTLDGAGRTIRRVAADGSTETTVYSNNGLTAISTTQTNVGPVITERDYDGLQLLSAVIVNGQQTFAEAHDYDGKLLWQTREGRGTRTFVYDSFRRIRSVYPAGPQKSMLMAMERLSWDGDDRLVAVDAFPGPQTTKLVYDGLGRILQQIDPLSRVSTFTHDPGSDSLASESLPSGLQVTNLFDPGGHLSRSTLHAPSEPVDEVKTFTYSPLGQIVTASVSGAPFGATNTVSITYDSLGRRLSESNSYVTAGVIHNYDLYDQWKSTWVGAPATGTPQMNHAYDKLRRLASVDVRGYRLANLNYGTAGVGAPLSIAYPQARETSTLSYDGRDRLIGIDVTGQGGVLRASRHTVYGTDGVIRQRQTAAPVLPQTLSDVFQVDFMGAVIAENFDVGGVPLLTGNVDNTTVAPYMRTGQNWRGYTTNRLANITSVTTATSSATRTYDAANQLTADDAAATIQYDAAGNLQKYGAASAPLTTFDLEKHPVSVDGAGGNLVTAIYDALGRRIAENESGTLTFFVWDGQQIVAHTNPDASLSLDVPGSGIDEHLAYDVPLSEVTFTSGREVYLHQDGDGSVFAATDGTGLLAAYTYSAFGEPHQYSKPGTTVSNRFLFQGQLFDPWTASYSMRAREYYPLLARFVSTDPIGLLGGTANLYGFVGGNPLSFADPLGLRPAHRRSGLHGVPINPEMTLEEAQRVARIGRRIAGLEPIPYGDDPSVWSNQPTLSMSDTEAAVGTFASWLVFNALTLGEFPDSINWFADIGNADAWQTAMATETANAEAAIGDDGLALASQAEQAASEIHGQLDDFAQSHRTTSVVIGSDSGGNVSGFASSSTGRLTAEQADAANRMGLTPLSLEADHGEGISLEAAFSAEFDRAILAASRPFCGVCTDRLEAAGFTIIGPRTAAKGF